MAGLSCTSESWARRPCHDGAGTGPFSSRSLRPWGFAFSSSSVVPCHNSVPARNRRYIDGRTELHLQIMAETASGLPARRQRYVDGKTEPHLRIMGETPMPRRREDGVLLIPLSAGSPCARAALLAPGSLLILPSIWGKPARYPLRRPRTRGRRHCSSDQSLPVSALLSILARRAWRGECC